MINGRQGNSQRWH